MPYKSQRQHRYGVYRQGFPSLFLPFEARELSRIRFSEAPYTKTMIQERKRIRRTFNYQADKLDWSDTRRKDEWREIIRSLYQDNKWIKPTEEYRIGRTRYQADPWAMFRYYRKKAIVSDDYTPKKSRRKYDPTRSHKKLTPSGRIDRDHVRAQRAKYKRKARVSKSGNALSARALTGDTSAWISQMQERLKDPNLSPQQRKQFEQSIRNLGGQP